MFRHLLLVVIVLMLGMTTTTTAQESLDFNLEEVQDSKVNHALFQCDKAPVEVDPDLLPEGFTVAERNKRCAQFWASEVIGDDDGTPNHVVQQRRANQFFLGAAILGVILFDAAEIGIGQKLLPFLY
jgi:hypothetical protein